MQEITLYHYWRSSSSWRVRWALNIKGINYKSKTVNLLKAEHKTEDFKKISPSGFVPALTIGSKTFSESMAIIEWIDENWKNNPLLPKEPLDRLAARQLYMTIASGTQPLQNLMALNYYSTEPKKKKEYAQFWINRGFSSYEKQLEETAGTYSFGESITMADLCLIPQCYNAGRFEVDLDQYPNIKRINETCLKTEACMKALPENQEGAL